MAGFLLPLLLLGVMYFFLIVPQRKKQKAHVDLLSTLSVGDEVITSGGIYGGVTEVDGEDLYLEIAPDIEIKVTKRAIADRTYRAQGASGSNAKTSPKPEIPEPYEAEAEAEADADDEKQKKNKN